MRGAKAESGAFGGTVPLIEGVFNPIKLLLLLTELNGTGLCGGVEMEEFDLLFWRLTRLPLERLGWMEDAGVAVPLGRESRVEEDLLVVPFESELLDSSLGSRCLDFFRLKSLKKGILAI